MNIKEEMFSMLVKKNSTIETVYVDKFPKIRDLRLPAILGSFTIYEERFKRRYMQVSSVIEVEHEGVSIDSTPSELARTYLTVKFKNYHKTKRYTNAQYAFLTAEWPPVPLLAVPNYWTHKEAYYLDIKSAWFTIANVVGWNLDYFPPQGEGSRPWLLMGETLQDYPFAHVKTSRSALISMGRPSTLVRVCPDPNSDLPRIVRTKQYNRFFNPSLWRIVADVLNCVASEALEKCPSLCYVNNDGFIITEDYCRSELEIIFEEWGLPYSVKAQGPGFVRGVGCYKVGDKITRVIGPKKPFHRIYKPEYLEWLKERFSRIASKRLAYQA